MKTKKLCSIRKLLHPYFFRYQDYMAGRFSNKKELLDFLKMVKLKEGITPNEAILHKLGVASLLGLFPKTI